MPTKPLPDLPHVTLENRWIKRSWCIADGLSTTVYKINPYQQEPWLDVMIWFERWNFEAILRVDGIEMPVARCVPAKDDDARVLEGVFVVQNVSRKQEQDRERLEFDLQPNPGLPRLGVRLHYELIKDQPLSRTWLTLRNMDEKPLFVESITLEAVYPMRLELDYLFTWHDVALEDDSRFIGHKLPRTKQPFLLVLQPGEEVDSFAMLSATCPAEPRWHLAARHDLIHTFAPHTRQPRLLQQFQGWEDMQDLKGAITEAAGLGIEIVLFFYAEGWSSGDLVLNPRLFPQGEADLKAVCEFANALDVDIGFYLGECIAPSNSRMVAEHPDWQFLGEGGTRYNPAGIGNMCPVSPWGDFVNHRVDRLYELGVRALQTDGPPYHQVCYEESHGHSSPQTARIESWMWERAFNRRFTEKGMFIQSPTDISVLFDGVAQIPGGYTEDDQSVLVGLDQITQFRTNLLSHFVERPPSCSWGFLLIGDLFGDRPGMVQDPENELVRYEHAVAGHLGYGLTACLHGKRLCNGPKSRSILVRWLNFYRRYRGLLTCRSLPLRIPDRKGLDAVMHCCPAENPCAVVVVFNPLERRMQGSFCLPLDIAGWQGQKRAGLRYNGEDEWQTGEIDDQGNLYLHVELTAGSVDWWEIRLENS